ncbi:hypothetical protein Plhal304r1_c054g0138491 [Plasmopara halstedii]
MTISDGTLRTNSGTWTLTCCFSAIDEDMLLYLAILGGKSFQATMTTKLGRNTQRKHERCVSRLQGVRDMVAHAIFCSSRRNGVRGIPFNDFFACLLGEFQDKLCKKMRMYDAQRLSCTIIPFLAPPNAKWPKFNLDQNSHGCTFGHLFRVSNKECVMSTFKTRESKMKNQFSSASASTGK